MDMTDFAKDNFDPKHWINNVFANTKNEDSPEKTCALGQNILNKLQLYVEQVNCAVEENCSKLSENLVEVTKETKDLAKQVLALKENLQLLKNEIECIEKNTGESLRSLEKLDRLKSEFEMAKQALHEADNWTILTSEIEQMFDSGANVEGIREKLVSLQQSLSVLVNVEDYEDRKIQLDGLKNRVEASASPHIVKAFASNNLEESVKYVKLFEEMERLPELMKYYVKCQKMSLCQEWKSIVDSDQDLNLEDQLRSLYDMLLVNWQKQMKWCVEVFSDVRMREILMDVYAEALLELEPNLGNCMEISVKQHSQPLIFLVQLHGIAVQFHRNLQSLYTFNQDSDAELSLSCANWARIVRSIYHPFVQYASNYGTLERQLLDESLWSRCLNEFTSNEDTDLVDVVRNISLTIGTVLGIVREATERCQQFTKLYAAHGLCAALNGFLLKYLDQFKLISTKLSEKISSKEDWSLFQACFSFQAVIGELYREITRLDIELTNNFKGNRNREDATYMNIILNAEAITQYEKFMTSINGGNKIFEKLIKVVESLAVEVHETVLKVATAPIKHQLDQAKIIWISRSNSVSEGSSDADNLLPDYSYSPLEYITQIGEYLLTLPQHLEPFLTNVELSLCGDILRKVDKEYGKATASEQDGYANIVLSLVVKCTCYTYADYILNLQRIHSHTSKQLAADIGYLGNVLEEVGLSVTESLQTIRSLLRFSRSEYHDKSRGFSPKLVAAVRQIRNIPSAPPIAAPGAT